MHHKPAQGAAAETSVHTSRVCLASRTVEQPQACSISQSFMATRVANPNCRWLVHAAVASTLYTSAAGQATETSVRTLSPPRTSHPASLLDQQPELHSGLGCKGI